MQNRRIQPATADPTYEDSGLFQAATCKVEVMLIPVIHKNNRGDLIIKGIMENDKEIAVTFAGRRAREAAPVVARLNALRDQKSTYANVRKIQLPMQIEGSWRPQFVTDENGFETRTFHLIAAKWAIPSATGAPSSFGQSPAHLQATTV